MITIKDEGAKKLFYFKTKYLGFAFKDESGFYVFVFSKSEGGCWSDYQLRWIADAITKLNKEWNDYINKHLNA